MSVSTLRHRIDDGAATALLFRQGPVAAQVLLCPTPQWRVLAAFAAGNSGAALWFDPPASADLLWRVTREVQRVDESDAAGRALHGVSVEIELDASELHLRQALLGSLRVIRDHQFDGRLPELGVVPAVLDGSLARWQRDRVDGAAGYRMVLEAGDATAIEPASQGRLRLSSRDGVIRLRFSALTGEPPLTPLSADELLTPEAADLPEARRCLEFLAFKEKWLAGSWRFHTYFGRDTLMSVRLLMPVLRPQALEAALASVLERLSPQGEVAHEEDVGEYAVLQRLRAHPAGAALDAPLFDYKMVDDDFMLLPVVAAYLLETEAGRARARAFLAQQAAGGESFGGLIARNLALVLEKARPFALDPQPANLIALKPGEVVGDWRDSAEGLAHGRYAYSVNAALVPAALRAAQDLVDCGLLDEHLSANAVQLAALPRARHIWAARAPACFEVKSAEGGQAYAALSLDAEGQPIGVMHCDFAFSLLLDEPSPERLARELPVLTAPYPAGLLTAVGMLVANARHPSRDLQAVFGTDRYHGAVVWSWQQALAVAGLARQLQRSDLSAELRCQIESARQWLWRAIQAAQAVANSELWSWREEDGRAVVAPFGPQCATADESNVAQLWSTVYLAVQP